MNRDTRDKFTATTDQDDLAYGESACLETPPALFAHLHAEFKFDVDLTANETNHLLPDWFGPGSSCPDALAETWSRLGVYKAGFSNPPYGAFIPQILKKAITQAEAYHFTSVFLLPLRACGWYKKLVLPYADEVRHVDKRILFWYQGKPKPTWSKLKQDWILTGALFDSIIVIYRPVPKFRDMLHPSPHFTVWDYPRPKPAARAKSEPDADTKAT